MYVPLSNLFLNNLATFTYQKKNTQSTIKGRKENNYPYPFHNNTREKENEMFLLLITIELEVVPIDTFSAFGCVLVQYLVES